MSSQQVIKLKLKSFDHRMLDQAVSEIVETVRKTGAEVKGPIPLPRKIQKFTLNKSPHIDKEAREQFEIRHYSRSLYISPTAQTVDALKKLDLVAGVEVEIKLLGQ